MRHVVHETEMIYTSQFNLELSPAGSDLEKVTTSNSTITNCQTPPHTLNRQGHHANVACMQGAYKYVLNLKEVFGSEPEWLTAGSA